MELPIRVMVVLFVAIAVAGFILLFASDIIDKARQNANVIVPEDEQQIIDKGSALVAPSEVGALMLECYKKKSAAGTVTKELCFIVRGDIPGTADYEDAVRDWLVAQGVSPAEIDVNLEEDLNTIAIYYTGTSVQVTP